MDIKYEIEPIFKIEFLTIKCINFKNKKKKLEKVYDIQKCLKLILPIEINVVNTDVENI